ncbi:MAG: hypothetical protein ACKO1F_09495 [Flammeovirgaceae bacterium]
MKKIKANSKLITILALTLTLIIQSAAVSKQSFFGNYSTKSIAIANQNHVKNLQPNEAAFPAALLVAAEVIGAAYAAGYVLGRLAAYAIGGEDYLTDDQNNQKYDRYAFAKFDN